MSVAQCLEGHQHCLSKVVGFIFAAEIQTIDLTIVTPLVECHGCLVVLESLQNGAVYDNLMILKFSPNYTESIVDRMVVDVNFGKTGRRPTRHPALVAVIVDHHHRTSRHYRMLTHGRLSAEGNDFNVDVPSWDLC
jgi:hypothetical protein